ncbi:MAG: metallophosphoesterase [Bacteroidales bacterium]
MNLLAIISSALFMINTFIADTTGQGGIKSPGSSVPPIFSFGLVADVQYCDKDASGSRYYRNSINKLIDALGYLQNEKVQFVINLGDLIDNDFRSYKPINEIIAGSGLVFHHVAGNHDFAVEKKEVRKIPAFTESKTGYYSFSAGKFRFVVLNGNEISTYSFGSVRVITEARELLAKLGREGEKNAMEWNGGISDKQLKWFESQLTDAVKSGEKVLVICHFPVFPDDQHNLLNYREVLDLLSNHENVIAWINGHNHAGNYGNFKNIHFVTLKGMVETPDQTSYAIIEVYENKLWIKGGGREKSQILAY